MSEAPCEVWFYHLERTSVEQALPGLLEKTRDRGWRALVRGRDERRLAHLDTLLWTWRDDSFLPHGRDGEPGAARQPILLTTEQANANSAQVLFLLDGADPGDLRGFVRCVVLFEGADEAQLAVARARWSQVRADGHPASYWRQQNGGWAKQG